MMRDAFENDVHPINSIKTTIALDTAIEHATSFCNQIAHEIIKCIMRGWKNVENVIHRMSGMSKSCVKM